LLIRYICSPDSLSEDGRFDLGGAEMATAASVEARDKVFIGGGWVEPGGADPLPVLNPASEETIATIPGCTPVEVDLAVEAARGAFDGWSTTPRPERAEALAAIAAGLGGRAEELTDTITAELGMPRKLTRTIQVGLGIGHFAAMPAALEEVRWEEQVGNSRVLREAAGVVGAITPWNYPLNQIGAKVAPALAAGCTVVLKPSEIVPLDAFLLAEVIDSVGLPPGVFNLVTGTGPVVGEAIAAHPGVDLVSFTGSTRAGRRVSELAAQTVKPVAMELGGKSPNVLLEDADLARAVPDGVAKCLLNSGQTCSALTRMLVPRGRLAEVEELAVAAAEGFTPGDPLDPGTRLGPLVSAAQRERVRAHIAAGEAEGARLLTGGAAPPEGLTRGYYVRPTVFSAVTPEMRIAREEIFGPVLAIMPYDGEDDAVRIANSTEYGLAGGVWAGEEERAVAVARRLRAGQVEINGGAFNPAAPFGGYGRSGHGRENGRFGLEEMLQTKSLQL
jgi:acyl-CoA reductase-like NAD-dependent aldehyde dehydrogenase